MPDRTNDGLGGTGDDAFSQVARRLADGKILDDMAPYGPEVMGPPPTEPDPPVESVLGDLSRPIVDAFSGHVTNIDPPPPPPPQPPLTEFGQAVRAFQRAYVFVSEHMAIAIVASLAIVFALAGVAFFSNAACGCDEPAQSGSSGAPASSARATAAAQVAQPTASPTLVRLTQKIVTVGFALDGVCDPYGIRLA